MGFRAELVQLTKSREEQIMAAKTTREHLIDVGLGLMHRDGYNATGLADILRTADVPKGSFYHHFGSKEDFAAAVLERYGIRAREHTTAILNDTSTPPLKRLQRYFHELVKIYGQKGAIPGCMIGRFSLEIAAENAQLREQVTVSFDRWQHAIAMVIRQAVEQEELPAGTDPESVAGFLLNSWQGALLRSQADQSDAPLETFVRYMFDGFLIKESKARRAAAR
jgi:TetR/AcrR family transcriptional repressor of nem operon